MKQAFDTNETHICCDHLLEEKKTLKYNLTLPLPLSLEMFMLAALDLQVKPL